MAFESWGRKALPGREWKRFQSLRAADRHAIAKLVMQCAAAERKPRILAEISKRLDPPKESPGDPPEPSKEPPPEPPKELPPEPLKDAPLEPPPKRRRKLPYNFRPPPPPVKREATHCSNEGCDWGVDHRPRTMEALVGNVKAKRALKDWMAQRRALVQYINKNPKVRGAKYRASLRGETTGDAVFDKGRIPAMALLHGPPGIGKTTLAELFMREHGFRVHEVNTSDVNTGDRLFRVLQEVVYAPRNGLILDEFDGVYDNQDITDKGDSGNSKGDSGNSKGDSGNSKGDHGMARFMDSLKAITVYQGPVVLIANCVTARHIKELRTSGHCLDARMFPIDDRDMAVVLTRALMKHGRRMSEAVKKRVVADAAGDVRHMLHAARMESVKSASAVGLSTEAVTSGSDAQSEKTFGDAAALLCGQATLSGSILYGDPRLTVALAFHNYLPATTKSSLSGAATKSTTTLAAPGGTPLRNKPAKAVKEAEALEMLSLRVDALSVADTTRSAALAHYGTFARISMDVLEQTFKALPVTNARNVYKSQLAPGDHNVTWPRSELLKYRPQGDGLEWLHYPCTLPRDAKEGEAWVTCIRDPGKLHADAQSVYDMCVLRQSLNK